MIELIDQPPLLTRKETAALISSHIKVSERHVLERIMFLPNFPKAILLPAVTGTKQFKRYNLEEIEDWIRAFRRAA